MSLDIITKGSFTFDVIPGFTRPQNLKAYYLFGGSLEASRKNRSTYFKQPLEIETPQSIDTASVNFGRAGYGISEVNYTGGSYTMLAAFKGQANNGSGAIISLMNLPKDDYPNRDRLYMMQEQVTTWHNGSRLGFIPETSSVSDGRPMVMTMTYDEPANRIVVKMVISGGDVITYTYDDVAANSVDPDTQFMLSYPDEGDGEGHWYMGCFWDNALSDEEAEGAISLARRIVNKREGGF